MASTFFALVPWQQLIGGNLHYLPEFLVIVSGRSIETLILKMSARDATQSKLNTLKLATTFARLCNCVGGRGSFCIHMAINTHLYIFAPGIQQLLVSLEKLSPRLEGREEDIQFLKDMLQTEEFHSIMKVYSNCNCLQNT